MVITAQSFGRQNCRTGEGLLSFLSFFRFPSAHVQDMQGVMHRLAFVLLYSCAFAGRGCAQFTQLQRRRQLGPCKLLRGMVSNELENATIDDIRFIHIPKTGGSSIEELSIAIAPHWGRYATQRLLDAPDLHPPNPPTTTNKHTPPPPTTHPHPT